MFEKRAQQKKKKNNNNDDDDKPNKWDFVAKQSGWNMCSCAFGMCCEKYHRFKSTVSNMFISERRRKEWATERERERNSGICFCFSFFIVYGLLSYLSFTRCFSAFHKMSLKSIFITKKKSNKKVCYFCCSPYSLTFPISVCLYVYMWARALISYTFALS